VRLHYFDSASNVLFLFTATIVVNSTIVVIILNTTFVLKKQVCQACTNVVTQTISTTVKENKCGKDAQLWRWDEMQQMWMRNAQQQ